MKETFFPGVLGRLITDERVPLGEVWSCDPESGKITKFTNLRRECQFDNNHCQLGLGHPGDHLIRVPADVLLPPAQQRYWVVDDASRILRTV